MPPISHQAPLRHSTRLTKPPAHFKDYVAHHSTLLTPTEALSRSMSSMRHPLHQPVKIPNGLPQYKPNSRPSKKIKPGVLFLFRLDNDPLAANGFSNSSTDPMALLNATKHLSLPKVSPNVKVSTTKTPSHR
ncbi:unnamed protein product [Prunus armeniaca]